MHFYREDRISGRRVKLQLAFSLLSIVPFSSKLLPLILLTLNPFPFTFRYYFVSG